MREEIFACERVLSRSGVRADPFRFGELWDFDSGEDISEGHRILIRTRRTDQGVSVRMRRRSCWLALWYRMRFVSSSVKRVSGSE